MVMNYGSCYYFVFADLFLQKKSSKVWIRYKSHYNFVWIRGLYEVEVFFVLTLYIFIYLYGYVVDKLGS